MATKDHREARRKIARDMIRELEKPDVEPVPAAWVVFALGCVVFGVVVMAGCFAWTVAYL